jgi:hypothetical protein
MNFVPGKLFRKEIIMDWLWQNWIWVLVFAAFIGLHMFGHGGHGSHGGQQRRPDPGKEEKKDGSQQQHHHH